MHYERITPEGTARGDITLVNGFTRSGSDFKAMARFLADRGWRVFVPDNRGSGKTDGGAAFTLSDIARDLVAMWEENSSRHSQLLGISFGGAVAMTTALEHPERVRSLVLVSTIPRWRDENWREALFDQTETDQGKSLKRYFSPRFLAEKTLLARALAKEMSRSFREPEKAARARAQLRAIAPFDARARLGELKVPTLVLHGAEDTVASVEGARELADKIPQASLDLVPGIGHLFLAEAPKLLYEKAAAFWEAQFPNR